MAEKYTEFPDERDILDVVPTDRELIRDIAVNIVNKNCVLFLGAGVNICPERYDDHYHPDKRPPSAQKLCEILIKDLNKDSTDLNKDSIFGDHNDKNLSRVAEHFQLVKGDRLLLHSVLKEHIKIGKEPSKVHHLLADMPFEYIMTTNYDQLLENAMNKKPEPDKTPKVGVYKRESYKKTDNFSKEEIDEKSPFVFKIHGDIDNANSIVITEEDYIHFLMRMRDKEDYYPIPSTFTDAIASKSILFIGYRLMDFNLRLLFKIINWGTDPLTQPRNYSVDPFPDMHVKKLITRFYNTIFIVHDSWKIVPQLKLEIDRLRSNEH